MLTFDENTAKESVFQEAQKFIEEKGLVIEQIDDKRPWGGFFVISQLSLPSFIETYFYDQNIDLSDNNVKLKPKFLIVAPHARLSWQYHRRRSELWRVITGPIGAILSATDEQGEVNTYNKGDFINVITKQRHRLIGLNTWGIVAEIWRHDDITNLSTEDDIVRVSDDFGR